MKKFTTDIADLFVSEDEAEVFEINNQTDAERYIEDNIQNFFFEKKTFQTYCELYARIEGLKPYAILAAHGNAYEEWVYFDSDDEMPVQRWIDLRDGNYGALLIMACNPGNHTPSSKKSLLWVSDSNTIMGTSSRGSFTFDLITPKNGIISSYTIDYELQQLRLPEPGPN